MVEETVRKEGWSAPQGGYPAARMEGLILRLAALRAGERVLDVGCGGGERLALFLGRGCDATGIDSSPSQIDRAKQNLGQRADLHIGQAEDLPFSDNVFDVVTLIGSLESTPDPIQAVAEAIRVCRGRILIGTMNRYSLHALQGTLSDLFGPPLTVPRRFLDLPRLLTIVHSHLPGVPLQWGSVLFLPWSRGSFASQLEERLPVMNNPFGAFIALAFPVSFSLRTIQEVIREPLTLKREDQQPMPGIVREGDPL